MENSQDDDAQMRAIQEEKAALAWQMYGLIILSAIFAAAFYGITII